ncbi:MAG: spermine/spermidine synthase domain-containing protein [Actinomycetota bacterium]
MPERLAYGRDDPASARFEELDWRPTPFGEISLRRRLEPTLQVDVYEAKLDDEFLMSSLFTVAEIALGDISLAGIPGTDLDVLVGGLGLGYTAQAVLRDPRVRSLHVIEALGEVIEWHRRGLLPLSDGVTSDQRCTLVNGDFFAMVVAGSSFGPDAPDRHDAVLVDIDHTPQHLLHPSHAPFYDPEGQRRLADRLNPGGVYALWSDDPPDHDYISVLERVFASCEAHVITFPNPLTGGEAANTVYVASVGHG